MAAQMRVKAQHRDNIKPSCHLVEFPLCKFIKDSEKPPLTALKNLGPGKTPAVTATAENNGIEGFYDVPTDMILNGLMSISKTHNTKPCQAFWHPYAFTAISTVHLIRPIDEFAHNNYAALYLCEAITQVNAWRYDYARPVKLEELRVFLPVNEYDQIDYDIIYAQARSQLREIIK